MGILGQGPGPPAEGPRFKSCNPAIAPGREVRSRSVCRKSRDPMGAMINESQNRVGRVRLIGHNNGGAIPIKSGRLAPSFEDLLKHALANDHGVPKDKHKESIRQLSEMCSDIADYENRLAIKQKREGETPEHLLSASDKWLRTFYQVLTRMLREASHPYCQSQPQPQP